MKYVNTSFQNHFHLLNWATVSSVGTIPLSEKFYMEHMILSKTNKNMTLYFFSYLNGHINKRNPLQLTKISLFRITSSKNTN